MKYRAEIDGLRALAVSPVILFHAGFERFSGGFIGVDVFFVISGYLITTIIIAEMADGKFSLVNFYERRARRILPALLFIMFVCLPFAWFWLLPNDLKDFGQSLVAVSAFSSNILFWRESDYFGIAAEAKPLLHTWSLAVEEQYYIIFPVFLMLTWRLGLRWILIIISTAFIVSLCFAQWGAYNASSATFYLLPARAWELLLGVFIAFYLKHNAHLRSVVANQLLSLIGLLMIVYSIVAFDENTPFPSLYTLIPTVGTGLLILSAIPNTVVHKLLIYPPIVGIGLISYSAYLWHQPLIVFAETQTVIPLSNTALIIICILSFVLARITYLFIEQPFRGNRVKRSVFISYSLALLVFFITTGLLMHTNNGYEERFVNINGTEQLTSELRDDCHFGNETYLNEPCKYYFDNIEWATFGDSYMSEIGISLAKLLASSKRGIIQNTFSGCRPIFEENSDDRCAIWTLNTIDSLIKNDSIKNVVISYRLTEYIDGHHMGHYPKLPISKITTESKNKIWGDLNKIFRVLVNNGKNVFFIIQSPELPAEFLKLRLLNYVSASGEVRGVNRDWWNKRNSFVYGRLESLPPAVEIFDPAEIFCDEEYCFGSLRGQQLYFDSHHPTVNAGTLILMEMNNRLSIFDKY